MTDLPPTIDAIMASIRARVAGAGPAPEDAPEAATAATAAPAAPMVPDGNLTIEALFRSMAEPQIKAWLDANLPEIVERLARAEIRRLTTGQ
jgi:cell pole-organizing protein PopZ